MKVRAIWIAAMVLAIVPAASAQIDCLDDNDCGVGLYCSKTLNDTGTRPINVCRARKSIGSHCNGDNECAAGLVCAIYVCSDTSIDSQCRSDSDLRCEANMRWAFPRHSM